MALNHAPLPAAPEDHLRVRRLGRLDYHRAWQDMQVFTERRTAETPDELWFLEHPPVFTLGRNGKDEHLLDPGDIPVVRVDRGGQVTYHGPGQLVVYTMLDLRRRQLGVQSLVKRLEQAVIDLLAANDISAHRREQAPGVYVEGRKIAALGLRVRRGCSFHGLSLNVNMDLAPFARINPCGYRDLEVTQLADLGIVTTVDAISDPLRTHLEDRLLKAV
jgi:lipoyl(octanoyl) transferase